MRDNGIFHINIVYMYLPLKNLSLSPPFFATPFVHDSNTIFLPFHLPLEYFQILQLLLFLFFINVSCSRYKPTYTHSHTTFIDRNINMYKCENCRHKPTYRRAPHSTVSSLFEIHSHSLKLPFMLSLFSWVLLGGFVGWVGRLNI